MSLHFCQMNTQYKCEKMPVKKSFLIREREDVHETKTNVAAHFFGDWKAAAAFFQEFNDTFQAGDIEAMKKLVSVLVDFLNQDGVIDYDALERKKVFEILRVLTDNSEMLPLALRAFDSALVSNPRVGEFLAQNGMVEKMIEYLSSPNMDLDLANVIVNILRNMSIDTNLLQHLYDCNLLDTAIRLLQSDLSRIEESAIRIIKSFLFSSIPNSQEVNECLSAVAERLKMSIEDSLSDQAGVIRKAAALFDSYVSEEESGVYRLAGLTVDGLGFFEFIDNFVCGWIGTSKDIVISSVTLIANALWRMDKERPIPSILGINIERYYEILVDEQALLCDEKSDFFFYSVLLLLNNYMVNKREVPDCMTMSSLIVLVRAVFEDARVSLKRLMVRIVADFLEYGGLQQVGSENVVEFTDLLKFIVDVQTLHGVTGKQETFDTLHVIRAALEHFGRHGDSEEYDLLFSHEIPAFLEACLEVGEETQAMAQSLLESYYSQAT